MTAPAAPSAPPPTPPPTGVLGARQGVLAAEHAAVFGYAALGPHLGPADAVTARAAERSHRAERDALSAAVVTSGAVPASSRADYAVPSPMDSPLAARRFALAIEDGCGRAWRFLLAAASAGPDGSVGSVGSVGPVDVRTDALRGLTAAAIRAMRWRELIDPARPTEPFPGI